MIKLLPCPFCASVNIDPEGWASTDRSGPACDDCGGSADTVELWNKRPADQKVAAVYTAARGLCMGFDWNHGQHAIAEGWRMALLGAVDAVEPLPDLKGKMKANVAS